MFAIQYWITAATPVAAAPVPSSPAGLGAPIVDSVRMTGTEDVQDQSGSYLAYVIKVDLRMNSGSRIPVNMLTCLQTRTSVFVFDSRPYFWLWKVAYFYLIYFNKISVVVYDLIGLGGLLC